LLLISQGRLQFCHERGQVLVDPVGVTQVFRVRVADLNLIANLDHGHPLADEVSTPRFIGSQLFQESVGDHQDEGAFKRRILTCDIEALALQFLFGGAQHILRAASTGRRQHEGHETLRGHGHG